MTLKNLSVLALSCVCSIVATVSAHAQTMHKKYFDGFYLTADVSNQNIYAGALLNNVDILTEDQRLVAGINAGLRHQFENHFVIGAELQYSFFDGDLSYNDTASQTFIDYSGQSQFAYGLTAGYAFGSKRDYLLHLYAFATKRNFDITINQAGSTFTQSDGQGSLRYGIGLEKSFNDHLSARLRVGTFYVDFRDLVTNIDVSNSIETNFGITYTF